MMRSALIAGLVIVCATPAFAGQDGDALTKAGLIGTNWALDCTKPASETNYHLLYGVAPSGIPVETLRTTPGADKVRELRNVQSISDEWMLYTMTDSDKEVLSILTTRKGDRKKSWWSVGKDGTLYISSGKFVDSGEPPWFEKCK